MASAGKGLRTWNFLQVLPQAGCVGQVESLPLYKRERLKLTKRLWQMSALKLFYPTAWRSDFHVRGAAFGSMFSEGDKSLQTAVSEYMRSKERALWLAQVLRSGGPQAQPGRRGVA